MRGRLACLIGLGLVAGYSCDRTGLRGTVDATGDPVTEPDRDSTDDSSPDGDLDGSADGSPDARGDWADLPDPADWVDLADWGEVELPDVGEDTPTAAIVGDPIKISDDEYEGGLHAVEWTGSEWGVVWGGSHPFVFRRLDPMGVPASSITAMHSRIAGRFPALEWSSLSYGFAGNSMFDDGIDACILDENGSLTHGPASFPPGDSGHSRWPDICRYERYPGWLIAYGTIDEEPRERNLVHVAHMDELGRRTGEARYVGESYRYHSPAVVGFGDSATVVWVRSDGFWQRTFAWPIVDEAPDATYLGASHGLHSDGEFVAASYRDRVVVAWNGGTDGGAQTLVYSPFSGMTLSGPSTVGSTRIEDRKPGLAPAHANGYLGLCWENGPGPWGGDAAEDSVDFQIIDEDGLPLGAPVVVASDLHVRGCAVAWSGSEFLVAYWNRLPIYGDECGIWVRRVRPLI